MDQGALHMAGVRLMLEWRRMRESTQRSAAPRRAAADRRAGATLAALAALATMAGERSVGAAMHGHLWWRSARDGGPRAAGGAVRRGWSSLAGASADRRSTRSSALRGGLPSG